MDFSTDANAGTTGQMMYSWIRDLFPLNRSITGPDTRATLRYLQELLPGMTLHEVPTGTPAFDWSVPEEWSVRDAYILDESGRRVIDWRKHNLHLVGYSVPVNKEVTLEELQSHLHSLPEDPDAIPYVTSFYSRTWGFCLTHREREVLPPGRYRVVIDSQLSEGSLSYGEILLPGESEEEVLLSTYVCHPSLANNELSGPAVTAALGRWLLASSNRRLSYRIIFVPETIGAIVYLSRNLQDMRNRTIAGYVVTCVGDDRCYSLLTSRRGNTLADRVARYVLREHAGAFREYSFLERGSDERQYCSPGIDLPVASVMRSKYRCYPEYHTSRDNLELVTPEGLFGAFEALRRCLWTLEENRCYRATCLGEPQMSKRGLYPTTSKIGSASSVRAYMDLLAYADGETDLLALSECIGRPFRECVARARELAAAGLLEESTIDRRRYAI